MDAAIDAPHVLLMNQDRWADARALDVPALRWQRLRRGPRENEHTHGWFVRRQGRALALFRWEGRLHYLSGRRLWDVEEADVRRRAVGPFRSLAFRDQDGVVGRCRWLDWELARRLFIPKWVEVTRDEDDDEHFDWSLFVQAVFSTDRRHRIGRPFH